MGLEAVVVEIREKGKDEAVRIQSESKQDIEKILAAAQKRVEEIKHAAETESEKKTVHLIGQDVSAANLLGKREILNSQKALLDEVYEATRKEIAGLPESFHREAINTLLTEAKKEISKGKIYCNARDMAAAKVILAENPEFAGFKLGEPVNIDGGVIIEGEGAALQIDYSYRTFLAKVWESGLKDASDILFG
jgi:V/A-type H+-transporting ATPase subunit E